MTVNFELLTGSKIISLKISSHGEARNIKLGRQVNFIPRVLQEVVMSLPHNHMTLANLFISS